MKRQIRLLVLLVVGPSLASAQTFDVTSGSMVLQSGHESTMPYTAASPDFSFSGVIFPCSGLCNPIDLPFSPGNNPGFTLIGDTSTPTLTDVTLSVAGAPWALPSNINMDGGSASAVFVVNSFVLKRPGTDFSTFDFSGRFFGVPLSELSSHPGADCGHSSPITCTTLLFKGSGSVEFNVVPAPEGALQISQATFTFKAPEPPTMALLLLGLAGVGFMPRRRKPHAM